MQNVQTGRIKKFFRARGFGFLLQDGAPDIFFHVQDSRIEDEDLLQPGAHVTFEISEQYDGRPRAINLTVVEGVR